MCLGKLTGLDHDKVFRVARRGQEIKAPTYVFMTDKELQASKSTIRYHVKLGPNLRFFHIGCSESCRQTCQTKMAPDATCNESQKLGA